MTTLLPALAVAFAAFCVWLTVRIVNRRERLAKRTAIFLGVLVVYWLSFGPACWLTSHLGRGANLLPKIYAPLMAVMKTGEEVNERRMCDAYSWMIGRPERVPNVPEGWLARFANCCAPAGWRWRYVAIYTIGTGPEEDTRIRLGDEAWEWSDRP